jgi:UTP-glucose-1-phosphate uridylyltransferase
MSNINEKFEQLLGRELTDKQKQQLLQMGKTLEIADNDALWSIVALLYSFEERFGRIPKLIEQSANAAAESSARQAEAHINEAVKLLAPSIQKTVEKSAQKAMGRLQLTHSLWMVLATILMTGIFGGVCFTMGNGSYMMLMSNKIGTNIYREEMKWAISSGFIVPGFLLVGYLVLKSSDYDDTLERLGYGLMGLGVLIALVLPLKLLGVIH